MGMTARDRASQTRPCHFRRARRCRVNGRAVQCGPSDLGISVLQGPSALVLEAQAQCLHQLLCDVQAKQTLIDASLTRLSEKGEYHTLEDKDTAHHAYESVVAAETDYLNDLHTIRMHIGGLRLDIDRHLYLHSIDLLEDYGISFDDPKYWARYLSMMEWDVSPYLDTCAADSNTADEWPPSRY